MRPTPTVVSRFLRSASYIHLRRPPLERSLFLQCYCFTGCYFSLTFREEDPGPYIREFHAPYIHEANVYFPRSTKDPQYSYVGDANHVSFMLREAAPFIPHDLQGGPLHGLDQSSKFLLPLMPWLPPRGASPLEILTPPSRRSFAHNHPSSWPNPLPSLVGSRNSLHVSSGMLDLVVLCDYKHIFIKPFSTWDLRGSKHESLLE